MDPCLAFRIRVFAVRASSPLPICLAFRFLLRSCEPGHHSQWGGGGHIARGLENHCV